MTSRYVAIASSCSLVEARLLKGLLEENGVAVGVVEESAPGRGFFAGQGNNFSVHVPEADAERAFQLIQEFEAEPEDDASGSGPADLHSQQSEAIRPRQFSHDDSISPGIAKDVARSRDDLPDAVGSASFDEVPARTGGFQTCPQCRSGVDAGRETCHWCGASLAVTASDATKEQSSFDSEDKDDSEQVVDAAALREIEGSVGDTKCNRAFILSLFGVILIGVPAMCLVSGSLRVFPSSILLGIAILSGNLISFGMCLEILMNRYELSPRGQAKLATALIVDVLVIGGFVLLQFIDVAK